MKKFILLLLVSFVHLFLQAQNSPFQDIRLSEDQRIKNLISLMTTDEKISCLSTRISVPRLGVNGTRTIEGLHGLAYSGPANWAVKGHRRFPWKPARFQTGCPENKSGYRGGPRWIY